MIINLVTVKTVIVKNAVVMAANLAHASLSQLVVVVKKTTNWFSFSESFKQENSLILDEMEEKIVFELIKYFYT